MKKWSGLFFLLLLPELSQAIEIESNPVGATIRVLILDNTQYQSGSYYISTTPASFTKLQIKKKNSKPSFVSLEDLVDDEIPHYYILEHKGFLPAQFLPNKSQFHYRFLLSPKPKALQSVKILTPHPAEAFSEGTRSSSGRLPSPLRAVPYVVQLKHSGCSNTLVEIGGESHPIENGAIEVPFHCSLSQKLVVLKENFEKNLQEVREKITNYSSSNSSKPISAENSLEKAVEKPLDKTLKSLASELKPETAASQSPQTTPSPQASPSQQPKASDSSAAKQQQEAKPSPAPKQNPQSEHSPQPSPAPSSSPRAQATKSPQPSPSPSPSSNHQDPEHFPSKSPKKSSVKTNNGSGLPHGPGMPSVPHPGIPTTSTPSLPGGIKAKIPSKLLKGQNPRKPPIPSKKTLPKIPSEE